MSCRGSQTMKKLPSGPKTPKLLQQLHWVADPVGYMEAAAREYGDIFSMEGFGKSRVFVSNKTALQQIFTLDTKQFTAPGEFNNVVRPLLGDNSVLMLSGRSHQRQRQLLMPPFHGDRMGDYGQLICDITASLMSQIPAGQPFRAHTAMQDISVQVIIKAVFGVYKGERYQLLKQRLSSMLDFFGSPLAFNFFSFPWLQRDLGAWSPWGKFIRQRQLVDEILYREITERRSSPDKKGTDILSLLMDARDEAGELMSDRELRDELMTLLFAGHETTASAMAWALYWVHYLPAVGEKLLAELDTLEENPSPMSIFKLPYLTAVCNETLRIYPVAMFTLERMVQAPVELLGYSLSPGVVVNGCIYLLHQREDIYPEPKHFQPERFLDRKFSPYEFMPFGAGARRCIGSALAMYEMKLVLATILLNYKLSLFDNRPVKPQRRGVFLAPAGGVKMVMKGRRDRLLAN